MPVYLTESVAQSIVDRAMAIIGYNVNVMDQNGVIIGSGDKRRLHTVHEGALKVLASGDSFDIYKNKPKDFVMAKQGINRPINFRRRVVGVVGISGHPDEVSQFADLVVMTADLMLENAAIMFEAHWSLRQRENIISELIHGTAENDPLFSSRSRNLGINPDLPRIAVLIYLQRQEENPLSTDEIEYFQYLLRKGDPDDLVALTEPNQFVLLHTVNRCDSRNQDQLTSYLSSLKLRLSSVKNVSYKVALGRYIKGISGVRLSYQTAQEALRLGLQLLPDQPVYRYVDFQLDSLMLDLLPSWKGKEVQEHIRPLLLSDPKGCLQKTLRVYINAQANPGVTAKKLHIHRNTLSYRLDKIQSLTERNPRDFSDLLLLHFALRMHELQGL
ncbi:CdaR family transcriptional regulator [Candidatus Sororendozoicomonas aggregata]|uniref:CdaR family transcriptional regulator n=1 Tax=Candidatus Sororendozoicomonas aggregata TaxID=3073239 RepID=UPI002ED110F4